MNDWIDWRGGDCPVNDDVLVEVIFGDMKESKLPANWFDWSHGEFNVLNIIAYRVVNQ